MRALKGKSESYKYVVPEYTVTQEEKGREKFYVRTI